MAQFQYVGSTLVLLLVPSLIFSPFYFTDAKNLEGPTTTPSGIPPSSTEAQVPPVAAITSGFPPYPNKTGLSTVQTRRTRSVEEMEASLAVNQLAILHLLDGESTGGKCERMTEVDGMSEVLAEVRKIGEDLSALRESQTSFQWRQFKLSNGLLEVKESLAEMRDGVKILEASVGELKGNHDQLNDTLTNSLSTLESRVSIHNYSLDTVTDHMSTLHSHIGTLHNITKIQNITMGTMMEDIQMLQDNDKVFQNVTNHLKEEDDAIVKDCFKLSNFSGAFRHEGQTFFINTESTLNWTESRRWCQAFGADLAQPTGNLTYFLQEVMKVALKEPSGEIDMWMGASDIEQEGQWLWLSGASLPSDFPWANDQPNNYLNQDCLEIWNDSGTRKGYNDYKCSESKYYVCGT